ncbi:hypothetical protein [Yoonia sp. MH D7]
MTNYTLARAIAPALIDNALVGQWSGQLTKAKVNQLISTASP